MSDDNYYKVGGSLEYQHPTYVVRQADSELYEGLTNGEFCYVLNSRQMGKSSLRVQMMKQLKEQGTKCASIDMTRIGSHVTSAEWYAGIVSELLRGFGLARKVNFSSWWRERELLPPLQRLREVIDDVLLLEFDQNLVIFLDEIDSILKIKFKDDFFAFIRACYNQRVDNSEYKRLTFCLLGVATPSDLIADKQRTPFNIGRAIELTGFHWEEAKLALTAIRDRILSNEQRAGRLLGLYQQILQQGEIAADDSPEQVELRLSGLVVKQQGSLKVYNRIYETVFNLSWVENELANLRPYSQAIATWLASNRHDESRLLRGQALKEALQWATDKSLSVEDYSFLAASQQLDRLQIQRDLEAERQANQILASATQQAEQLLEEAKEGTKIERAGVRALQLFEGDRELEALLLAMEAGVALHKRVQDARPLSDYPATSPLLALQVILDSIRERNQFSGHQGEVMSVSFSPNGEYIATASYDSTARLWDFSGKQLRELKGHEGAVTSVSFSPNGEYIATASDDGSVRLWDLLGNQIAQFQASTLWLWEPLNHKHNNRVNSVSFNLKGDCLATALDDGSVRLWDLSGNQIAHFKGHQGMVRSVSFSPNGEYVATASYDGTARLWNLSGNQIAQFIGHQNSVNSVSFSPNGEYVATASHDSTARLWDLSGNQIAQFMGHQGVVLSVSFSPNGEYIATASYDRTAKLWDLSGNQIAQFIGHQGWVLSVSFSPNGECLATASADGTVRLWNLSANQLEPFQGHQGWVLSVSFSPNGDYIATASYDDTARLWDLSGNQIVQFLGHQNRVNSVSFSPSGEYVATASDDRTASLWDLSGNQIAQFLGHQGWVLSVSFNPKRERLATASADGTVRLWDLSGNQIAQLQGHQSAVRSVSWVFRT